MSNFFEYIDGNLLLQHANTIVLSVSIYKHIRQARSEGDHNAMSSEVTTRSPAQPSPAKGQVEAEGAGGRAPDRLDRGARTPCDGLNELENVNGQRVIPLANWEVILCCGVLVNAG